MPPKKKSQVTEKGYEEEVKKLKDDLDKAKKESKKAQTDLTEIKKAENNLKMENECLRKKIIVLEANFNIRKIIEEFQKAKIEDQDLHGMMNNAIKIALEVEIKKHEDYVAKLKLETTSSGQGPKQLENEMQNLRGDHKKLTEERDEANTKYDEEVQKQKETEQKETRSSGQRSNQLDNEMQKLREENKKLTQELDKAKKKNDDEVQKQNKENERIETSSGKSTKQLENEIQNLGEENKKLKQERDEAKKKYDDEVQKQKKEDQRKETTSLGQSSNQLDNEMQRLREENKTLIQELDKTKKKYDDEVQKQKKENEQRETSSGQSPKQLENEIQNLGEENKKLKQERDEAKKKYDDEVQKQKKEDQRKSKKIKATPNDDNEKFARLQQENENLRTRLSEMAGAQMTHNNPNIADLSDAFRPTKLSEEYTQLYDNQWTDAFEEMDKNGTAEQSIITTLLDRLKECHAFCNTVSLKFMDQLKTSSLMLPGSKSPAKTEHMSVVYKKQLQDMKKNFGVLLRDQIKELYWSENKDNYATKTRAYIDACIDLCWLMAIQEPPVVIDDPAKKSSSFDADMYKTYTTPGKKIDFVVWPPLRLHKGGPLLSKGVAQGIK